MPEKKNDVVEAEKYNEAIEKVNSEKIKREKAEEQVAQMQKAEEERKVRIAGRKKSKEEDKWKTEMEDKDKKIKELEEASKTKVDDTPNPKGVVQPNTTPPTDSGKILDERYGTENKDSRDMSPIQRLIHFKTPTTQKYNSQKMGELLGLQASALATDSESLPEKFHDAQRNNIVGTEIKIPKN